MTYEPQRRAFRPESGEAPFGLDEVFFSRTESRGVIQAGNEVFRRVADYDWPELIGAPHRLIRHPDMPRAVFWLLWDTIKQGRPIGAYVKNRAKDGLYYWVFAVIAPCEGGYLSARIKPSSDTFRLVQREYATLLAAEAAEKLSPEASAARLAKRLGKLGFADYDLFGAHALSEELMARDAGLGRPADAELRRFLQMIEAAERLNGETEELISVFHRMRTIPHNMRVIASRLEPTGGPVSTLSKNYGAISQEMSDWFTDNVARTGSTFAAIRGSVSSSLFHEGMTRILRECDAQLVAERPAPSAIDIDNERRILGQQMERFSRETAQGIAQVRNEATRIAQACETMHRHVLGLSSTRVLAKIEGARLQNAGESLNDIITQLGRFQSRISDQLDAIAAESQSILALAE